MKKELKKKKMNKLKLTQNIMKLKKNPMKIQMQLKTNLRLKLIKLEN